MLNKDRSQSGFSLVEIMVACGIMAVVALAFATLMTNQQKSLRFVTARYEVETVDSTIKQIFRDANSCAASVQASYASAPTSLSTPLTLTDIKISRFSGGTWTSTTQYSTAVNPSSYFRITSITIREANGSDPTPGPKLVVGYELLGEVLGPRSLSRMVDIFIDFSAAPVAPTYGFKCALVPFAAAAPTVVTVAPAAIPCGSSSTLGVVTSFCPGGTVPVSCGIDKTSETSSEDVTYCTINSATNSCRGVRDLNSGCDPGITLQCNCL